MKLLKRLLPLTIAAALWGCSTQPPANVDNGPGIDDIPNQPRATAARGPLSLPASRRTDTHAHLLDRRAKDADGRSADSAGETNIWNLIVGNVGFADQVADRRVRPQIDRYAHNQEFFDRTLKRAELYLPYVLERVLEDDLPAEIALLPFVESAYNPFAYSHSGAAGLWQFIAATGDHMELERNDWYDGRRDVISSTEAALDYLEILYHQFDGDWLLTLAAYNAGPGTIRRAMAHNRDQGKPTDFWSLDLRQETTRYVPRLIALTKVIADPNRFGVELAPISSATAVGVVDLDGPVDLGQAADLANLSADEIHRLNPGYSKWVTPPSGPYYLVLPEDQISEFKQKLAALPTRKWRPLESYAVAPGDNLSKLARGYGLSVAELAALNELDPTQNLQVGQTLRVPLALDNRFSAIRSLAAGSAQTAYEVKSGDSLWTISRSFDITLDDLLAWNNLSRQSTLQPGQLLQLRPNREAAAPRNHQVKSGDSLYKIARRYKVRLGDLLAWNNLSPDRPIRPGQVLKLFTLQ